VGLQLVSEADGHWGSGMRAELSAGNLLVRRVERDGPAQQAGLQVGDELLALDGVRLRGPEDLPRADAAAPPPALSLLFCRDGRVRQTVLAFAPPPVSRWSLVIDPDAPEEAQERRRRWRLLQP
jgi:predicted metalloprotease with PDZ domain